MDRRSVIAAALAAPVVIAAPVSAATQNRHGKWLAEYDRVHAYANEPGIGEEECARRCTPMSGLERRTLNTPALNADEMRSKIRMAMRINEEGFALNEDESMRLLIETMGWIGRAA